jgi:hypothetical protein
VNGKTKIVGARMKEKADLESADPFLRLVQALRGPKPFIPRGVFRFGSSEQSNRWSLAMMARNSSRDPRR